MLSHCSVRVRLITALPSGSLANIGQSITKSSANPGTVGFYPQDKVMQRSAGQYSSPVGNENPPGAYTLLGPAPSAPHSWVLPAGLHIQKFSIENIHYMDVDPAENSEEEVLDIVGQSK